MQFTFGIFDIVVFVGFIVAVMSLSLFKSRSEKDSEDYFLAGRGLSWWLVGFSLIAANISTEQFVGMSGNAASHVGLAIASYEWMAAITLVIVGFGFLPYFLRAGIYTMPEFLEYRYNSTARTIMAVATIFIYILLVGSVTYSGALTIRTLAGKMGYNVDLITGSIFIGLFAMIYVTAGGLKACAWADLIQGSALILGGTVIMFFAFHKLGLVTEAATIVNTDTGAITTNTLAANSGALERFWSLNSPRMNMFLPKTDAVLPWTALLLGLWIPNFYYWGLNQYITQRTLGSASLAQGQKGIVFAAFLKLLIPFVIVIPGIIAFNLFSHEMQKESISDNAPVIAKYYKANPNSQYIQVVTEPTEEAVANWPAGNFMLAIYPNSSTLKQVKTQNPFVLPLEQKTFEQLSVREYSVFETEDKASQHLFPAFVEEVKAFNAGIKESAKTANKTVTTERFIAYKYDTAMAQLLGNVLPQKVGLVGFVLAALLGAVVSSLAAMLNAASTIFTMDLFKKYIVPQASQKLTVLTGRICVVVFALFAVILAPQLGNPKISNSIFTIIQESQGFISPGILAVFVFGLIIRRAPASAGVVGLLTNIVVYGAMKLLFPEIQFLNRMAICFALCLLIMAGMTILKPLSQPVVFKQNISINLESSSRAKIYGLIVIILTLLLYFIFSPLGLI